MAKLPPDPQPYGSPAHPVKHDPWTYIVGVHWGNPAVFFDGQACLYNLPVSANSDAFLCSVWLRSSDMAAPDYGSGAYTGKLWGSPNRQQGDQQADTQAELTGEFDLRPTLLAIASSSAVAFPPLGRPPDRFQAEGWLAQYDPSGRDGWVHLMVAVNALNRLSVTVNDDIIFNNETQPLQPDLDKGLDTLPFGKFLNTPPSCWTIGGNDSGLADDLPSPDHPGLVIGMAALYVAPNQYLDITQLSVRNLFRNTSSTGTFSPADIGADGSTPTGIPPLIYCDGDKDAFPENRATGAAHTMLSVFGTLQTIDGP